MSLLEIENLKIELPARRGRRTVVRDVSLTLGEGEAVGIVGESGSGKSMTARAAMRLLPAGATVGGSVRFDSRDVLAFTPKELRNYRSRDVAMIYQDPAAVVNPMRRVGDFLTEQLRFCLGTSSKDALRRATQLLADVQIADPERVLRRYPHELSGGMLQRVVIAAAVAPQPKLLLADEPTTALDVTTQAEVVGILDTLRRETGLALIFISHDLELAAAISDRIALMYAGAVVEVQDSQQLERAPLHPYSAGLLQSRPNAQTAVHRLPVVPGRPVAAYEAGPGCAFLPRCAHGQADCATRSPVLTPLGTGSGTGLVACHRAEELAAQGVLTREGTHV